MIEVPQTEGHVKDEQIEGLGLEMHEEPIAMIAPNTGPEEDAVHVNVNNDALRRQKTHGILTDHEIKDLIGVRKKSPLDSFGVKTDSVEFSILGNLKTSLFWEEKVMVFLHAMQLLGYYYVLYYEQVPEKYTAWSDIFAAFIGKIDYIAFYRSAISEYVPLAVYSLIWAGVCILLFIITFTLFMKGVVERIAISGPYALLKIGYYTFEFLAFPFLMNTVPNAVCKFNTDKIDIKLANCWSMNWHIVVIIAAALTGAIVIAVGIMVVVIAYNNYVHDTNENHETYLKMKELEYVFDLSYIWRTNWFFLFSSFKREGLALYHRGLYYLLIISLSLVYSFLQPYISLKFYVVVAIVVVFCAFSTIKPPFRCGTSNMVYIILLWGTIPTLILLYIRTTEMRSALIMVDDNFGGFLIALNLFVLLLVIMMCGIFMSLKVRWPVDPAIVEEVTTHPRFISMLGHLREAKDLSVDLARKRRFYFVNKTHYLEILGYLEHDFSEADKLKHFFKEIILEFIEELSQYYTMIINESLLPHPRLEQVLDTMRQVFLRRAREQILINPRRQKALMHLLTFRMIYDQYWSNRDVTDVVKKVAHPAKLAPLEELKFQKGEGGIDPKHQNIYDEEFS